MGAGKIVKLLEKTTVATGSPLSVEVMGIEDSSGYLAFFITDEVATASVAPVISVNLKGPSGGSFASIHTMTAITATGTYVVAFDTSETPAGGITEVSPWKFPSSVLVFLNVTGAGASFDIEINYIASGD